MSTLSSDLFDGGRLGHEGTSERETIMNPVDAHTMQ